MGEIRKLIKKRHKVSNAFGKGFMFYCLKGEVDYTIDKIMEVVAEIKKDFPCIEDKHIAIKSFTPNELILYFYCMEIPNDVHFEEFKE